MHMWASWDGKHCSFWVFCFSWHKKFIFHFLSTKNGFFVKHLPKLCFKNIPRQFEKIVYHILCTINQLFAWKRFYSHPSRNWQISADSVGSGSNLNYRCFIVCSYLKKNYFYMHKYLFHHRSIKSLARFYPRLGMVTPTVLATFWNRHKKFKNNQKNSNPSCYVMLCDLVAKENNKLEIS
jgi:hypothetical protein